MGYKIKDPTKHAWNPLNGKVGNFECPCGSGRKVKKCHGPHRILTIEHADFFARVMTNPDKEYFKAVAKWSRDEQEKQRKKLEENAKPKEDEHESVQS